MPKIIPFANLKGVTVDNLVGREIELASDEIFWKLDSGTIDLNRMLGVLSAKVTKSLTRFDRFNILSGLRMGRIVFND